VALLPEAWGAGNNLRQINEAPADLAFSQFYEFGFMGCLIYSRKSKMFRSGSIREIIETWRYRVKSAFFSQ
jgi:hypothetical protein